MAGSQKKLNNLSYQVLGVLARQPRSGYDIVKQLEHFRPAKTSQVYPTLAKLEEQGLVASQDVAQTSRPNKRLYTVTEAGQLELIAWVGTEPDAPYNRDDFLTMVYSAWIKQPIDLKDLFKQRKMTLQSKLDTLADLLAATEREHIKVLEDFDDWPFFKSMLIRRRMALLREDLSWTVNMMHRLQLPVD